MAQPIQNFVPSLKEGDYCINIGEWYCHHWEFLHALREILQNWQDAYRMRYADKQLTIEAVPQPNIGTFTFYVRIDGVRNTNNYIKYIEEEGSLVFANEGSFKVHNLLLGPSEKKHSEVALGQFGEGMKLYMLILLKHDCPVYIESGDRYYGPTLKNWDYQYDGKVLYVHTKPRNAPKENTVVTIKGISKAKFEEFKYLSLSLVSDYQEISFGKSTLIISKTPLLKGKVFKKGILVALRYPLDSPYSYNLDDLKLGRERDSINDPEQFKDLTSKLHASILNQEKQLQKNRHDILDLLPLHMKEVVKAMKKNGSITYYVHKYLNQQAANRLYRYFLHENGEAEELYPVQSAGQEVTIFQTLSSYGLQPSFYPKLSVSWEYATNLCKSSYYQTITAKVQKQIKVGRALTDAEKNELKPIVDSIGLAFPKIKEYSFLIYEHEKIPCFKDPQKKEFNINKKELGQNQQKFKMKLAELLLKDLLK